MNDKLAEIELPKFALIVAGGSGSRMESKLPKQFLLLEGKPLLMHTIQAFHQYDAAMQIIVVLPATQIDKWKQLCQQHAFQIANKIQAGGATRFESVKKGLALIEEEGLVAIHDGVRPLVNQATIDRTFIAAYEHGSGVAAVDLKDSLRQNIGTEYKAVDRSRFKIIQTPQTFRVSQIQQAYNQINHTGFTDDASVSEAAGNRIFLVAGAYNNFKITTPEDLHTAAYLIAHKKSAEKANLPESRFRSE